MSNTYFQCGQSPAEAKRGRRKPVTLLFPALALCLGLNPGNKQTDALVPDPGKSAEQTEEMQPLHELEKFYGTLHRLKAPGNRATQSEEFLITAREARGKLAAFTEGGNNLDFLGWGLSVIWIYEHAFAREAATFEDAKRLFDESISLLEDAKPDVKHRVKLELAMRFADAWTQSHPESCAELLDAVDDEVKYQSAAKYAWAACSPWIEIGFLRNARKIPPERRKDFVKERTRNLVDYLAREDVEEEQRIRALRYWVVDFDATGHWKEASEIIEKFWARRASLPNLHLARLWVALYGEGDWNKARETAQRLPEQWSKWQDGLVRGQTLEVYYSRIFSPGYELQRQATTRVNKYLNDE